MKSSGEDFFSERELVRRASYCREARENLRQFVTSDAQDEIQKFVIEHPQVAPLRSQLQKIAVAQFDKAFNVYLKNGRQLQCDQNHFPQYYRWWVRQALTEHLIQNS